MVEQLRAGLTSRVPAARRVAITFGVLVLLQALHSIEEYRGRLYDVFPPARLISGAIAEDRQRGFVLFNVALVAFGVWCAVWPVRLGWPVAPAVIAVWLGIEILNGVGHPLWSLARGGYTPGVLTAPALLIVSVVLLSQLRAGSRRTRA